jgi:hypothetical protein
MASSLVKILYERMSIQTTCKVQAPCDQLLVLKAVRNTQENELIMLHLNVILRKSPDGIHKLLFFYMQSCWTQLGIEGNRSSFKNIL